MEDMLPRVERYINENDWSGVPVMAGRLFTVTPLAQGEYNLNYLIESDEVKLVFRLNIGTQIGRDDQIVYEYRALELLKASGRTPVPYFVDDSRTSFERGILIMEYLPGVPLDYRRDLEGAAKLFADVHKLAVPPDSNHLIREKAPLSIIFEECDGLLAKFFDSGLGDTAIRDYLADLREWMRENKNKEKYFQEDPWMCIVNTEVNNRNFIVDREKGSIKLVDWEMPRYGDPSSDLCHFCSPLTTLWKTDYRMTEETKEWFLEEYGKAVGDAHLSDTISERVRLKDPYVYLRGISWSAYGWAAYQTDFDGMKNQDTWETLKSYMDIGFIRSLFDPFMKE